MKPSSFFIIATVIILSGLLAGGLAVADDGPTEEAVFFVQ
jgi:hypothetical protein